MIIMERLDGRVAFVTGVARGQGRSHALRLAKEGADIIGVDLPLGITTTHYPMAVQEDLAETAELIEKTGRRAYLRQADVRDLAALRTVIDSGVRAFGRLDIVVVNAGIFSMGAALDLDEQVWQDVIDVNLTGAWHRQSRNRTHPSGWAWWLDHLHSLRRRPAAPARHRALQRGKGRSERTHENAGGRARTRVHPVGFQNSAMVSDRACRITRRGNTDDLGGGGTIGCAAKVPASGS
jgi:NAD(P)-dependent dehydrogenase (short-subunit alcohol dehydrogenase family)